MNVEDVLNDTDAFEALYDATYGVGAFEAAVIAFDEAVVSIEISGREWRILDFIYNLAITNPQAQLVDDDTVGEAVAIFTKFDNAFAAPNSDFVEKANAILSI